MRVWESHMRSNENEHEWSDGTIWFVAICGFIISLIIFFLIWKDGVMTNTWSWARVGTVLVALISGLLVGWMLYPRIPFASWFRPGGMQKAVADVKRTGNDGFSWAKGKAQSATAKVGSVGAGASMPSGKVSGSSMPSGNVSGSMPSGKVSGSMPSGSAKVSDATSAAKDGAKSLWDGVTKVFKGDGKK